MSPAEIDDPADTDDEAHTEAEAVKGPPDWFARTRAAIGPPELVLIAAFVIWTAVFIHLPKLRYDRYGTFGFEQPTMAYKNALTGAGHFAFVCNHGGGHSLPPAVASSWQFLSDHPYGTNPSPYAGGLPSTMPSYCTL